MRNRPSFTPLLSLIVNAVRSLPFLILLILEGLLHGFALAIQYGYYRYETGVLVIIIVILIIIVQLIQWIGDFFAKQALKK